MYNTRAVDEEMLGAPSANGSLAPSFLRCPCGIQVTPQYYTTGALRSGLRSPPQRDVLKEANRVCVRLRGAGTVGLNATPKSPLLPGTCRRLEGPVGAEKSDSALLRKKMRHGQDALA